jgi:VanZ family protein
MTLRKHRVRAFLNFWLPALVWMTVIFSASSDNMSFEHSSRVIGPLLRWLMPNLSAEATHAIVVFIRKLAHLTEFALLGILCYRALRHDQDHHQYGWRWSTASLALGISAAYACTDEIHQMFVPSREASLRDVLIDTSGAALGLFLLWIFFRTKGK